jgi:hypothetical protein
MLARNPGTSLIFRCRGFSWSEGWILLYVFELLR